ncbi:MAG: hypothetical protein PWQ08_895 [Clostridiales bacterium]|jgi:DNA-binding CsgD family transcriptional regulator|nr:hypothetical protein [Clostridiales bacterium]
MQLHNRQLPQLSGRAVSVIVFALFFAWQLAFSFEGQILYALAGLYGLNPSTLVFAAIASTCVGLFGGGFVVQSMQGAKRLILGSTMACALLTVPFFFAPNLLWLPCIISSSLLAGACVAAWGFFYQGCTPRHERIKTAADGLIYSNILMILLNVAALKLGPHWALGLSVAALGAAFCFALHLPATPTNGAVGTEPVQTNISLARPLAFLCLFIVVITINSGLMYQVQGPAFAGQPLAWLTSWYWAVPYIGALFIMRNLPRTVNRTYLLYVGIAMIGFSFIFFLALDRSAISYLIVDTLMLGACGIYDLFWWSILGEMMDFGKNPARVLGIGISANVLGVLLGGVLGNAITNTGLPGSTSTLLALGVVCVTLVILPPLHKYLLAVLKEHAYLTMLFALPLPEQQRRMDDITAQGHFTGREREIATLLLAGKTYRSIAAELQVSENTVRTHIKNIYTKNGVQSRMALLNALQGQQRGKDTL